MQKFTQRSAVHILQIARHRLAASLFRNLPDPFEHPYQGQLALNLHELLISTIIPMMNMEKPPLWSRRDEREYVSPLHLICLSSTRKVDHPNRISPVVADIARLLFFSTLCNIPLHKLSFLNQWAPPTPLKGWSWFFKAVLYISEVSSKAFDDPASAISTETRLREEIQELAVEDGLAFTLLVASWPKLHSSVKRIVQNHASDQSLAVMKFKTFPLSEFSSHFREMNFQKALFFIPNIHARM